MQSFKDMIPVRIKRALRSVGRQFYATRRSLTKGVIATACRASGTQAKHLVISGCSRSGTTMLYNMVRSSATGDIYMPNRELSALDTWNKSNQRIVTKRPLDIFRLANIDKELGAMREVIHLILVRDPRDLVSSKHSSVPNQYFQGYDYQFFVRPGFSTFTGPGIAAVAEAIKEAETAGQRVFMIRYEDLVRDPENVRRLIAFATGFPLTRPFASFHTSDIPDDLSRALNGIRPVEVVDRPAWTKGDRYARAMQQLQLFPEMEELATRWGYSPTEQVRNEYNLSVPEIRQEKGTIVAFHTDDDIYRAEAQRFTRRLDQLGLKYDITVVPPRGEWVENCAMKPQFLLDVRKRLRGHLLYLDVDAFVHRDPWPYLSLYNGHMAAYFNTNGDLASGTLLLSDDPQTTDLLGAWVSEQILLPKEYDQRTLQAVVARGEQGNKHQYCFQRLPPNLCYVPDKKYSTLFGEIIIEHLQASRISNRGRRGDTMTERIAYLEQKYADKIA